MNICTHTYMCIYMHSIKHCFQLLMYGHIYIHIYMYRCINICIHTYVYVYIYVYIYHIYIYRYAWFRLRGHDRVEAYPYP